MSRTIRILHVLHAFSPGGLENGVVNIINRSPDHLVHELCFLSQGGEFLQRLTRPVRYHELRKHNGNDIQLIGRLLKLCRRPDIDIIHTRNWAGFDGVIAACFTFKPALIHSEHGRDISDPQGLKHYRNFVRRTLAFRAEKFVAVSKELYRWLRLTVRIPEGKLIYIPNGVDTERFQPGMDFTTRRDLGIADDEFVVGTIGRLDPIKNHAGLINAISTLNRDGNKVRLVIIGDGPSRSTIEGLLKKSALTPEPVFVGYRPDVERLYKTFNAFVLNSFAEGMSNTLLEAMASGLPIVCTAVGGSVELVSDGHRGILVRPGDDRALSGALGQYVRSPGIRASYSFNARRFIVQHFSLGQMIDQYVSLYESVA